MRNPTGRTERRSTMTILLSCLLLAAGRAGADTFAVGAACPHPTIASAVLAAYLTAGDDLIKVTQDLTNQAVVLDDFEPSVRGEVTIRGGYSSCADATSEGRSVVDGIASSPVFRVRTVGESRSAVLLENLEISGGERGAAVTGGGELALNNVLIAENSLGGALVGSGGLLATDDNTVVDFNGRESVTPALGGGIQCVDGALILGGAIVNNRAELGAGLGLSGCTVELEPGLEIGGNVATSDGGGIYASFGSALVATEPGESVVIALNAAERGGGVYLADSSFVGIGVAVTWNQAELEGGGIYAFPGSVVSLLGRPGACSNPWGCSGLYDNFLLTPGGEGSAVYAWNASVTLRQMTIQRQQNRFLDPPPIPELQPSLFFATGASADLTLENLKIWNNRATQIVEARAGASVFGGYLTSARNGFVSGGTDFPSVIDVVDTATEVAIYSSILWDHGGFFFAGGSPSLAVDCTIVSSTVGVPAGSEFITVADPLFLDPDEGNLRVSTASPAVDYCDEVVYPFPGAPDFDGEARGVDLAGNPNGAPGPSGGLFDIGHDELQATGIFADGFESGSTSAWTTTVPG